MDWTTAGHLKKGLSHVCRFLSGPRGTWSLPLPHPGHVFVPQLCATEARIQMNRMLHKQRNRTAQLQCTVFFIFFWGGGGETSLTTRCTTDRNPQPSKPEHTTSPFQFVLTHRKNRGRIRDPIWSHFGFFTCEHDFVQMYLQCKTRGWGQ